MNKVILIGRLTKDPDLRFTAATGTAAARFTIAVNRPRQKDKQQEADFINCIAYGKRAEVITQYLVKGKQVAITGAIRTGSYDAKDGTRKYITEILIDSFEFLGNGKGLADRALNDSINNSLDNENEDMMPVDDDIPF